MNEKACRFSQPVFTVCILIIIALIAFGGSVSADAAEDALILRATLTPESSIPYTEIRDIQLLESFEPGIRTFGIGSNILTGRFKNDQFGGYQLYAYHNVPLHIAITADSGIYVFGGKNADETRALYEELTEHIR